MSYKRFVRVAVVKAVVIAVVIEVAIGLAGFACAADRPSSAPAKECACEPASMAAPMHGEDHMSGPLHRQMMTVLLLPEMPSELGLSAQQESQLRGLKKDLLAKSKDIAGQTATRRRELDTLLSGDTSRTRAVKALFEKIADLRAQLQYAGFETANKMKALLDDAQRAKFNAMTPAELHRLMMSRANMGEMMQLMAPEESMSMQKGMGMQGGMRQGSGMMSGSHGDMTHDAPSADAPHAGHDSH